MKYFSIFSIPLFLSACTITINSKKDHSEHTKTKFPIEKFSTVKDQGKMYQFVEITAADIKSLSYDKKNTIIYQLAVWCSPCVKEFKKDYLILDSLSKANKGVNVFVISTTYGFGTVIEKLYRR